MSCTGFDVRDYFFGELPESERASAERHVSGCIQCAADLEELQAVRSGLLLLRDEEAPQRIGFVSDKVFQPSPLRRWLGAFWMSGARLGFASAAMLSVALLVFAVRQPSVMHVQSSAIAPAIPQPQVDVKAIVAAALAGHDAEQDKKTRALLAATEAKHRTEEQAMALRVSDYITNVERRIGGERLVAYSLEKGQ